MTAKRTFIPEDQEAFAAMSGDRNPMHVDAMAARRTQAGSCAVHGVHSLLWALDQLTVVGVPLADLASVKVDFNRFLVLDRVVHLDIVTRGPGRLRAELRSDDARAVTLELRFGPRKPGAARMAPGGQAPVPDRPAEPEFDAMGSAAGWILPPGAADDHAKALFPHACAALGAPRVIALGLLSSLVGMVVPGLHSILAGFELDFSDDFAGMQGLAFAARRADERFRLITLAVSGPGLAGTVTAFARFPPVPAPSLRRATGLVRPGEFAARRALVIGGSRGIGAATAKLLAAGGARVALTYMNARTEAEAIREEINCDRGHEFCSIWPYDADAESAPQLEALPGRFTHVYYFATSRIFSGGGRSVFDRRRFDAFFNIYVAGFQSLITHLHSLAPEGILNAFYPSSIAVVDRPKDMTEYAMAKAAGEILCADLTRASRGLAIMAPRLPRILTDQTATVPPVPAADALEVMLPLLRAERA